MTDLYDTDDERKKPLKDDTSTKVTSKEDTSKEDTSKENEKKEMINKISENLYELESILQEKENEEILRGVYYMLQKRTQEKASEEEQCSIQ
tara:strand:- start:195 stop:470 length:276 start_codon:yes stop_codon:yes gene_type:complete